MANDESCCICKEILTGQFPEEYCDYYHMKNRFCYENRHLVVLPSISPIVAGHVLVIPKEHVTNLMYLNSAPQKNLFDTTARITERLKKRFGLPYIFEHGVDGMNGMNCGVDHAHLHIIPLTKIIAERVNDYVRRQYYPETSGALSEILNDKKKRSSYLLFGQDLNYLQLAFQNNIPSQFMRRIIAKELGRRNWDWKDLYGWDDFHQTYLTFREKLMRND